MNMSEWKEFNLTDLAEIHSNRRVPLSSGERASRKGSYPYYGASGIIDFVDDYLFEGEHILISEDGENLSSRKTPIAFLADGKFWVNNHAHVLKGKKPFLNKLLTYVFSALDLAPFVTGAVQPKLSKENLLSIPIWLPVDESEQQAIAEVLGSLDDKIDLLHHQNKTLESLAQTLFRHWFIDPANDDWKEITLSEIADHRKESINPSNEPNKVFSHYSIPAFDNGREPSKEWGREILSNKYKVIENSIMVSKLNPRTPRVWPIFGSIDKESSISSTEFQIVEPKNREHFGFIYNFLKSPQVTAEIASASGGTSGSHQRARPEDIFGLTLLMPPANLIEKFEVLSNEYLSKINKNIAETRTLNNLRDALLPKLMNGEAGIG